MRKTLFIFLLLISRLLYADGLPLDSNGNISVPHSIIEINESQQLFLNSHRYIILTQKQKIELGKLWTLDTVEVLDPNYHDCTCARIYGIWISKTEIAFLDRDINQEQDSTSYYEFVEMSSENISYYKEEIKTHLFIGFEGELFYLNKIVSLEKVKEILNNEKLDSFIIFLPPKKNNSYWNKIKNIQEEINRTTNESIKIYWM